MNKSIKVPSRHQDCNKSITNNSNRLHQATNKHPRKPINSSVIHILVCLENDWMLLTFRGLSSFMILFCVGDLWPKSCFNDKR